ncbi:MAG: ATP synthase F0 subunit C [bacterium]|nr:ATP synthase F0 subunit C [bacterium]
MEYLGLSYLGAGLGAGLVVFGAALGIGRLASGALEGMARQPELSGDLRTAMIIAAALIEGFTFFALVVTFMLATAKPDVEAIKALRSISAPVAPIHKPAAE